MSVLALPRIESDSVSMSRADVYRKSMSSQEAVDRMKKFSDLINKLLWLNDVEWIKREISTEWIIDYESKTAKEMKEKLKQSLATGEGTNSTENIS